MKSFVCLFWAVLLGFAGLTVGGPGGAVVGAILGYCLGAKITS